ncbi:competence type IV pilus minor pilin ComGD [Bacillus massilinigeriensis]|uniref:competence type IV pilus minor pilin ComGD n=1 Tax=Bacillus mediterraneensis TaxID=1805474 RepID=UPI0009F5965B|nr:competence type IV pilus minor pilin ComGD [Bacillus mediterraneensis]
MKHESQGGFTLIEMLLVLSIAMIIFSAGFLIMKPSFYLMEKTLFMSDFRSDLLLAQQAAISHQQIVSVNIMPSSHTYYIRRTGESGSFYHREYSSNVTISPVTMPSYFQYMPDGNVNRFGSMYVFIGNKALRMTFTIGSGRVYVVEK